ncbi:MAG: divergent PAP2 family protein [Clostridiales bacterium]|nr:divergent PAP2 family protein [Clostridiales bacterium]
MDVLEELLNNDTLWIALLAFAIAQLIKVVVDLFRTKKINTSLLIGSGGMPSSHSAFVTAMTTAVGLQDGFDSALFAISAILSMVVMYDAAGVRRAAGRHAAIINTIIENVENSGLKLDKKLKELLGHSPIEVAAGAILGIAVAILCIR